MKPSQYERRNNLIILEDEETWPVQVIDHCTNHHDFYLKWEQGNINEASCHKYDNLIDDLDDILRVVRTDYILPGYHCTRLTDYEIQFILDNGMQLPNKDILNERINFIEKVGLINSQISEKLKSNNQADDENRAGKLWFCFFPPYYAEQWGIERFFISWGGEALYNSHERDAVSGHVLKTIGTPCIVEAYVPIKILNISFWLSKLIRRFLINRGLETSENIHIEDYIVEPIPSQNINRIIKFPESDFLRLTGCDAWNFELN